MTRSWTRALAPGLLVALPALPWVWDATVRASWATLGRDQGIFQYVAWAVSSGAKAYRDVRDVNGPLVVMIHSLFLALGGGEEHRFRVLDLLFVGGTAAFAGSSLPALFDRLEAKRERAAAELTMALATATIVLSQYLAYGFWETAQRESFFDGFVLVSMGLQFRAQAAMHEKRDARLLLAVAGAMSLAPWFGKPTYLFFTVGQLAALLVDDVPAKRLRRVVPFVLGGVVGAAIPFAFIATRGDVASWAHITFVDVPTMYRFIWPRPAMALLEMHRSTVELAAFVSVVVVLLVVFRLLPRRAIPIATLPIAGLGSAVLQAKGFPYHFHPATLGAALGLVVIVATGWNRARGRVWHGLAAIAAIALGARAGVASAHAPFPDPPLKRDADSLVSAERLAPYDRVDYFPFALRSAAEHIARYVAPNDTVQTYGMDPYLLFLAKRRSATPYIYAYDLDVDAALHGSFDPGGPHPSDAEAAAIRAMRDDHERDMIARLDRSPPGAFVFIGRSPLMTYGDALADFQVHCPDTWHWLYGRYRQTANFSGIRVWLRADLALIAEKDMKDDDEPQ